MTKSKNFKKRQTQEKSKQPAPSSTSWEVKAYVIFQMETTLLGTDEWIPTEWVFPEQTREDIRYRKCLEQLAKRGWLEKNPFFDAYRLKVSDKAQISQEAK